MKVEVDAGVYEYVARVIASVFSGPKSVMTVDEKDQRFQERVVMSIIEGMVAAGAADHQYDKLHGLDIFTTTGRLIRNWSWAFPGDEFGVDLSERHTFKIRGRRARYFNNQWLKPDPDNPLLSWPS